MRVDRYSPDELQAIKRLQQEFEELKSLVNARVPQTPAGWTSYTPVLTATTTNPTLGTGGVAQGRYLHDPNRKLLIYRFHIQFGTSGVNGGSGSYRVSTPVGLDSASPSTNIPAIGMATLFDWSVAGHKELATIGREAAGTVGLFVDNATVSHNAPFTWTVDDRFGGTIIAETQ